MSDNFEKQKAESDKQAMLNAQAQSDKSRPPTGRPDVTNKVTNMEIPDKQSVKQEKASQTAIAKDSGIQWSQNIPNSDSLPSDSIAGQTIVLENTKEVVPPPEKSTKEQAKRPDVTQRDRQKGNNPVTLKEITVEGRTPSQIDKDIQAQTGRSAFETAKKLGIETDNAKNPGWVGQVHEKLTGMGLVRPDVPKKEVVRLVEIPKDDKVINRLIEQAKYNEPEGNQARIILKVMATWVSDVIPRSNTSVEVIVRKDVMDKFISNNFTLSDSVKAKLADAISAYRPKGNPVIANNRGSGVGTKEALAAQDQKERIESFLSISTGTGHLFAGLAAGLGSDTATIKAAGQFGDFLETAASVAGATAMNRPDTTKSNNKESITLFMRRAPFQTALSFDIGEVKSINPSSEKKGLQKLQGHYAKDLPPGKAYALISYDAEGNLFMRRFIVSANPYVNDLEAFNGYIGKISPENMPKNSKFGESKFGNEMELTIKQYLKSITGDMYEKKSPSESGSDLTKMQDSKSTKMRVNLINPKKK